jgi:hypothetical protein
MPVRNVLYMAALSASRYNPALKAFSQSPRRRQQEIQGMTRSRRFRLREFLEQLSHLLGRHADAGVSKGELDPTACPS